MCFATASAKRSLLPSRASLALILRSTSIKPLRVYTSRSSVTILHLPIFKASSFVLPLHLFQHPSYFYGTLILLLEIFKGLTCYHRSDTSLKSLLKVVHLHFLRGHLVRSKSTQLIKPHTPSHSSFLSFNVEILVP